MHPIALRLSGLIAALLALLPASAQNPATSAPPAPLTAQALAPVEAALVRVELDLRYSDGEAPYGVIDQDPGSRQNPLHRLEEVVQEERPLETTGYLVSDDTVIAMDPTIHPRFIRAIHVRQGKEETTATVTGYGTDRWVVWLHLDRPLPGARPLRFGTGTPAHLVTSYRFEGGMLTDILPFPGRLQRLETGPVFRVAENQGVAVDRSGTPLGLILSRRLPADNSWQTDPRDWPRINPQDHAAGLTALRERLGRQIPRVRLSFRSPKTATAAGRERYRMGTEHESDEVATELDVAGLLVSGRRVLIPTRLRPQTTARLERITVHPAGHAPVSARFEATLRDLGALVATLDEDVGDPMVLDRDPLQDLVEHYILRAEVELLGEDRSEFYQHTRIGALRIGPRLEPYPELADPTGTPRTFLFRSDGSLLALPLKPRDRFAPSADHGAPATPELTPARLLATALDNLPASSDAANVPRSEEEENRVAWLGVELQGLTQDLARANHVAPRTRDGETGALVTYVHPDSPAAGAGIQPGAILLRLSTDRVPNPLEVRIDEDGMRGQPFPWERLDEIPDQYFDRLPTPWSPVENRFVRMLTDLGFGTSFRLEYLSGGMLREEAFSVVPGPVHYEAAARYESSALGLTVRDLTYEVRRYMQRRADDPGVVVSSVEAGSRASVAGLKPYEVITHVDGKPVDSAAAFEKLVDGATELQLTVKRMAKGRIVSLRPGL